MFAIHKRAGIFVKNSLALVHIPTNRCNFVDESFTKLSFVMDHILENGWLKDVDVGEFLYSITPESHPEYFI